MKIKVNYELDAEMKRYLEETDQTEALENYDDADRFGSIEIIVEEDNVEAFLENPSDFNDDICGVISDDTGWLVETFEVVEI